MFLSWDYPCVFLGLDYPQMVLVFLSTAVGIILVCFSVGIILNSTVLVIAGRQSMRWVLRSASYTLNISKQTDKLFRSASQVIKHFKTDF